MSYVYIAHVAYIIIAKYASVNETFSVNNVMQKITYGNLEANRVFKRL